MKQVVAATIIGVVILVSALAVKGSHPRRITSPATPVAEVIKPSQQTFVVLGDTGTGGEDQYHVGDAVADYCNPAGCDAVFIAGDVIYDNGVTGVFDQQFNSKFEMPYQEIRAPFYLAFGNHDYRGCRDCYYAYADRSEKWHMPGRYYQHEFENAVFYVIDTNNFDRDQQEWLMRVLEDAADRWRIVVGHHPLEAYDVVHAGEEWNGRDELEKIICSRADLYVSGHSHLLMDVGVIDNCRVRQLISGAGGAHLYDVLTDVPIESYFTDYGFLRISVRRETLIYGFHPVDQSEVYSNIIDRGF